MALTLGLDIGSSSVIAGLLRGTRVVAESPRTFFRSRHDGPRVEVEPATVLTAVAKAIAGLGARAGAVDIVTVATMGPAWMVMGRDGQPLTPLVTHQDRRSVAEAKGLEERIGASRHLELAGNRPFPGGISSSTWAWFRKHEPGALRGAALVGHLNTFLHRQFTGARVIDPANASFTGLYDTLGLGGWSEELCANLGVSPKLLPEVLDANIIAGRLTPAAARRLGLRAGTPMMTGVIDGSAGMLLAGAEPGQLYNVVGSTDVLALCTDHPRPHGRLLTRAIGVGRRWLQNSTIAAMASSIYWVREQFFADWTLERFRAEVRRLGRRRPNEPGVVRFEPYMAGERTSVEQRQAAFTGLTLATTREDLLKAVIEALIAASAERLPLLAATGTPIRREVVVSGGSDRLDVIMRRDWPGNWRFRAVTDATMRGLGKLEPRER